jgi:hypothetical protein
VGLIDGLVIGMFVAANTNAAALAGAITQSDPPDTSSPGAEHIRQRGQFPF